MSSTTEDPKSADNSEAPARRRRGRSRNRGPRLVPLHRRSSSHFDPEVREAGAERHASGGVELEVEGHVARARVQADGESAAEVGLDWSEVEARRILYGYCGCDDFGGGKACEHVWAALLALGDGRRDVHPPGADRISLRKVNRQRWEALARDHGSDAGGDSDAGAAEPPARRRSKSRPNKRHRQTGTTSWRSQLDDLHAETTRLESTAPVRKATRKENGKPRQQGNDPLADTCFLVDTLASADAATGLVLDVFDYRPGPKNKPGRFRRSGAEPEVLSHLLLPDPPEELTEGPLPWITALPLEQKGRQPRGRRKKDSANGLVQRLRLTPRLHEPVLEHLADAGLLRWWNGSRPGSGQVLEWDSGPAWRLGLRLESAGQRAVKLVGALERNGDTVPLTDALVIAPTSTEGRLLALLPDRVVPLKVRGASEQHWLERLRTPNEIVIPMRDLEEALSILAEIPGLPHLEVPDELRHAEEGAEIEPRLSLRNDPHAVVPNPPLLAEVTFCYGDLDVSARDPRPAVVDPDSPGSLIQRDSEVEHQCLVQLLEAGVEPVPGSRENELQLRSELVPSVAETLLQKGWDLEVSGIALRGASRPAMRIESDIDWFELSGNVDFDGDEVDLSEILTAVRKGDRFIELPDGSKGLLPASWSETYDSLAKLSEEDGEGGLRFRSSQAMLVDSLLTGMPEALVDEAFAELREKLRSFESIEPKKEPRGFQGELRSYQRDGLGWLSFLREFGLGGILADDMGLGKTVQVLALLRGERTPSKTTGKPWLVVVPRSLLYNWIEEAKRFTPTLKVAAYIGPKRDETFKKAKKYDLLVTTYGTLRRDVAELIQIEFDTVILDEAQAIKNRDSQSAKAARSLRAQNRLALTGTPIENHLGELGSILEFLNPGLLGRMPLLDVLATSGKAGKKELEQIAAGIRPFILRRTKAEVLPDLPPKTEQVLHCELNKRQREIYDQLRAGYQETLLRQAESEGLSGASIQVLEALLRLRQVACHPGLVRDEWADAGSAKLDTLFELVEEVLDEGHKIIVFSQFTKLLGFVRERAEAKKIEYSYLDGQTRDREAAVNRFQEDEDCNLFLISLKAGGVGLNLTAAEYVFLLDPWWNPAVEAQAIDRAHRIGQTQPVFAYRMIAEGTVEEKITELQQTKRDMADAILGGESGGLGELTADDLRVLLS